MHEVRGSSPCPPIFPGDEGQEAGRGPGAEVSVPDTETIFTKIIRGEIPCEKVYEDDLALAFRDIHPAAPVHFLVVPKRAIATLGDAAEGEAALLGHLMLVAERAAKLTGIAESGYRVVLNNGRDAGQEVLHLHLHVMGGRGFGWPPG